MTVVLLSSFGGQPRVILDALRANGEEVTTVLDDTGATQIGDLDVAGTPDDWREHRSDGVRFAAAMADPGKRRGLGEAIVEAGEQLVSVIHPRATVAERVELGVGVAILAGAVIGPDVRIGDYVIVNSNAAIDHDCVLETASQIGPGVTFPGGVTVQEGAMVGAGAVSLPGRTIGAGAIVGAGAVITRDVEAGTTVAGSPARPLG